jgi:hypothetical protein
VVGIANPFRAFVSAAARLVLVHHCRHSHSQVSHGLHGTHAQEIHGCPAALSTGSGAGGPCSCREDGGRAPTVELQRWT